MNNRNLALLGPLAAGLLGVQSFNPARAVEPIACDPEPTDMTIGYGDFLSGSNCSISSGDTDVFRFAANAGERVLIRGTDQSGFFSRFVCVELLDPDGLPTANGADACADVNRQIDEEITKDGVHTILLREAGASSIAYGLVLERVAPPTATAEPLCIGCTIDDAIDAAGDVDLFTFFGTPGDVIQLQGTDQSGFFSRFVCAEILDPDGLPTPNGAMACADVTRQIDETIQKSGIHTVVVREAGASTIPYSVNLQCFAGACQSITRPVCDIQLNQATYVDGDTVIADVFRLENQTAADLPLEVKIWATFPGNPTISLVNLGADGSFVLPAGGVIDVGPLPLFAVSPVLPRGAYEFSCRLLDPPTGRLLMEDLNPFELQ